METKKLLEDNILSLENLLLKKGNLLKLKNDEIIFILKIIPLLRNNVITEKEIFKNIIIKKKDLDNYLANLLSNKYIKSSFEKSENYVTFNFAPLWENLLRYYDIPSENSLFEEKSQWFLDVLNFESDSIIFETLAKWISQKDWAHIADLINKIKLSELKNVSWNSFVNIHDKLFENSSQKNKKNIKEILNFNWLEE